jgi:hypothetical protein
MKVASATLLLATFCCASAFGLHGPATAGIKNVGISAYQKPMVQAMDVQGNRLSSSTSNLVSNPVL